MRYDESSPPLPESSTSISPDRPLYARRSTLVVAAAAIAPAALAGWVLTEVLSAGAGDDNRPPRIVMPLSASASAPSATAAPSP
ncbi:N-acetylmuramoyl-L-alanine amidase, partial [Streptomyces sp. NPDC006450]